MAYDVMRKRSRKPHTPKEAAKTPEEKMSMVDAIRAKKRTLAPDQEEPHMSEGGEVPEDDVLDASDETAAAEDPAERKKNRLKKLFGTK